MLVQLRVVLVSAKSHHSHERGQHHDAQREDHQLFNEQRCASALVGCNIGHRLAACGALQGSLAVPLDHAGLRLSLNVKRSLPNVQESLPRVLLQLAEHNVLVALPVRTHLHTLIALVFAIDVTGAACSHTVCVLVYEQSMRQHIQCLC